MKSKPKQVIGLLLLFPSWLLTLPCFCVAGAALMEISEVHRKVHLELEENVSTKEWWKQFSNCIVASPICGFEWQRRPKHVAQAVVPQAYASALSSHSSGLGCSSTCWLDIGLNMSGTPQHALNKKAATLCFISHINGYKPDCSAANSLIWSRYLYYILSL